MTIRVFQNRQPGKDTSSLHSQPMENSLSRVSPVVLTKEKNFLQSNDTEIRADNSVESSLVTYTSSSVDSIPESRRDSHPVDLDEIDDKLAERNLTDQFEKDDDKASMFSRQTTGPIDLDLLEDDFHYYDDEDEEDEDGNDGMHLDTLSELSEDSNSQENRQKVIDWDELPEGDDKSIKDMNAENQINDNDDDLDDLNSITELGPVDMDDVYDLEATFESILDQHEDEFMVWTSNRKSCNGAAYSFEKHRTSSDRNHPYGKSLRREGKSSRWSTEN